MKVKTWKNWTRGELAKLREFTNQGIGPSQIVKEHGEIGGRSAAAIALKRKEKGWVDKVLCKHLRDIRVELTPEQMQFRDEFIRRSAPDRSSTELAEAWKKEVELNPQLPSLTARHLGNRRRELKLSCDIASYRARPEYKAQRLEVGKRLATINRTDAANRRFVDRQQLLNQAGEEFRSNPRRILRLCFKCMAQLPASERYWGSSKVMCVCCALDHGAKIARITRNSPGDLPALYAEQKRYVEMVRERQSAESRYSALLIRDLILRRWPHEPCAECTKCKDTFLATVDCFRVIRRQARHVTSCQLSRVCRFCEDSYNRIRHQLKGHPDRDSELARLLQQEIAAVKERYLASVKPAPVSVRKEDQTGRAESKPPVGSDASASGVTGG